MSKPKVPPAGEIRQSQMLTSYGPGSMVDLPNHSVIVGGLESWTGHKERIYEERLENWLKEKLGERFQQTELKLFAPPIDTQDGTRSGVTVYQFPHWFLGQVDMTWKAPDGRVYRTRPLIPWGLLVRGGYLDDQRKHVPVVPVRFVQACVRGHISDIDWYAFVRNNFSTERNGALWFDEGGAGSDIAETYVRDEKTGLRRPLSDATIPNKKMLGTCRGKMPWLGPIHHEVCDKPNRLLTRSASNVYFSQTVSAISLPDRGEDLRKAVDLVWEDHLQYNETISELKRERSRGRLATILKEFTDEELWAEVVRRKNGTGGSELRSIKSAELETLLSQKDSIGEDKPDGSFFARTHPLGPVPPEARGKLGRLVLVHRLREVIAQIGFTRFEAAMPNTDGELDLEIELAPLARETTWLPAVQNRGEGIFLSFAKEAIEEWRARPAVVARGEQLLAGFDVWKERKGLHKIEFPGLPYIMLHSLAHLLISALALDCGYSASSLRERIYDSNGGFGILLYTGSPGSEGTLGGLVDMGKNIGRHLERALELGRLCSNDPVCAQHEPRDQHEERFLHGATCHGCLLLAETSCERRNELLDRALVVPTVTTPGAAFFADAS